MASMGHRTAIALTVVVMVSITLGLTGPPAWVLYPVLLTAVTWASLLIVVPPGQRRQPPRPFATRPASPPSQTSS